MPIATGHMNFFQVNECGLYRNQDSKSHGLEIAETFNAIYRWAGPRAMRDTLPWDESSRTGSSKMYCYDIFYDEDATGDYMLVLWKSDTDNTGSLWGAQQSGVMGQGKVIKFTDEHRGEKVIWGRPAYYWVIPAENTVVSIKFDHSVCDSFLFQDWVSACITNRVPHANKKKEFTETNLVRLTFTDGTESSETRFRYGFDVSLRTLSTSTAELGALAKRITHIVKRETVKLKTPKEETAEWVKLFRTTLPYLPPRSKAQTRQIEIRAEARPTVQDVRQIIDTHARHDRRRTDWENVGFQVEDGGITWVDRYRIKSTVEVERSAKDGTFTASALYDTLRHWRSGYLGMMKGSRTRKAA